MGRWYRWVSDFSSGDLTQEVAAGNQSSRVKIDNQDEQGVACLNRLVYNFRVGGPHKASLVDQELVFPTCLPAPESIKPLVRPNIFTRGDWWSHLLTNGKTHHV